MQYIVHIGTNKTGTSSLQRVFYDNRAALSDFGIAYPETGIELAAHHNLSRALKGVDPGQLNMPSDWIERLHAECAGADLCLLSSENFHTMQDPSRMLAVCPAGQTRIIVYIREHAAHLVSWYQQAIQSRNTAIDLDEFVEFHALSFTRMINGWVAAYGESNVTVRLYERGALKDGDIVSDFCEFLKPGVKDVLTERKASSNPSIAGNLLFVKRVLNCFLTKEHSLSIANEVAGLVNLDPTFKGKIPVNQRLINRIGFLSRDDRNELNDRVRP